MLTLSISMSSFLYKGFFSWGSADQTNVWKMISDTGWCGVIQ